MVKSVENHEEAVVICTCIYLSAKVNEYEQARLRDIVNVVMFTQNEMAYIESLAKEE